MKHSLVVTKLSPQVLIEMGSGASTAVNAPIVGAPEFDLDVQELTVEDICSWIGAQGANATTADMCARLQESGKTEGASK